MPVLDALQGAGRARSAGSHSCSLVAHTFEFCLVPPQQALGIATKINKGTIEIVSDVHLIKAGDKVGASQATLLSKLGVKPFKYGLGMLKVSLPAGQQAPAALSPHLHIMLSECEV